MAEKRMGLLEFVCALIGAGILGAGYTEFKGLPWWIGVPIGVLLLAVGGRRAIWRLLHLELKVGTSLTEIGKFFGIVAIVAGTMLLVAPTFLICILVFPTLRILFGEGNVRLWEILSVAAVVTLLVWLLRERDTPQEPEEEETVEVET